MRRSLLAIAAAMTAMCVGSGCVRNPVNASTAVLTSGASLSQGRRTPAVEFTKDDYVVFLVDITWPEVTTNGGRHYVHWEWYRDNQLVSRRGDDAAHRRMTFFATTPWTLETRQAAATLGPGHFKVETFVDDHPVASAEFDIKA